MTICFLENNSNDINRFVQIKTNYENNSTKNFNNVFYELLSGAQLKLVFFSRKQPSDEPLFMSINRFYSLCLSNSDKHIFVALMLIEFHLRSIISNKNLMSYYWISSRPMLGSIRKLAGPRPCSKLLYHHRLKIHG